MSAYSMTWLHSEYEPKERLSAVDVTRRGITTEWKSKAVFHAFDDERVWPPLRSHRVSTLHPMPKYPCT